ncbi:MAG TPA: hypothetical protein VFZ40_18770 [Pyrinomonadaceae bacterium]
MSTQTKLTYDISPDHEPLYTTVDQLNQSRTALTVTAQNSSAQPVTVTRILIELIRIEQGADKVQLLLPGSAHGIEFPPTVTGPGQTTWTVKSPADGQFLLKANEPATFQPNDKLSFSLQKVVIREGGTGTAFVPVFEEGDKEPNKVGIGITQSTLAITQFFADPVSVIPGQPVRLTWKTNDAKSGELTLPGANPSQIQLDSTNLATGQITVNPYKQTTYALVCQGSGPRVMQEVTVSMDSVDADLHSSADVFAASETITLFWNTSKAASCEIGLKEGATRISVAVDNHGTSSCKVRATAGGQTLILVDGEDANKELGRIALPNPCPDSVTFVLWVEGQPHPIQSTCLVNLVRPEIQFNKDLQTQRQDAGDFGEFTIRGYHPQITVYNLSLNWEVKNASSVLVQVNGSEISREASGKWQQGDWSSDAYSATISCTGFGGTITQ